MTKSFKVCDLLLFESNGRLEIRLIGNKDYVKVDLVDHGSGIKEIELDSTVSCLLFYGDELENVFIDDFANSELMGHRGTGQKNIKKTKEKFLREEMSDGLYYENTITSFNKAWDKGAKWVELDIQLTKNQVPVIFHDFVLDIDGTKKGINQLEDLEFFNYFGGSKDNTPTSLESIFPRIHKDLALNLEIKYPDSSEVERYCLKDLMPVDKYVEEILSVLSLQEPRRMCFSSFNPLVILYLRIRLPKFPVMFIIHHTSLSLHFCSFEKAISFCSQAGLNGLVMDFKSIKTNPVGIKRMCTDANLKLFVYGSEVSDKHIVKNLLEIGVDGIITDNLQ